MAVNSDARHFSVESKARREFLEHGVSMRSARNLHIERDGIDVRVSVVERNAAD